MKTYRLPSLPEEVAERVRKRDLIKYSLAILLTLATVLWHVLFLFDYLQRTFNTMSAIVFCVAVSVIPFFALRCHKLLLDRSYVGKIVNIEYTTEVVSTKWKASYGSLYRQSQAIISIETEKGKRFKNAKLVLRENEEKLLYSVGDTVVHFHGVETLWIMESKVFKENLCLGCGSAVSKDSLSCPYCSCRSMKRVYQK